MFQQLCGKIWPTMPACELPDGIGLAFIDAIPAQEARELLTQRRLAIQEALLPLQEAREHGTIMAACCWLSSIRKFT